jgi:hypothetical protein
MIYTPAAGYIGTDVFRVASSDCGGGFDTTTITITIANCALASSSAMVAQQGLSIFPNPNSGSFACNLTMPQQAGVTYVITNVLGEKIKTYSSVTNVPLNIEASLPAGVYFLTATSVSGNYNARFIVK